MKKEEHLKRSKGIIFSMGWRKALVNFLSVLFVVGGVLAIIFGNQVIIGVLLLIIAVAISMFRTVIYDILG